MKLVNLSSSFDLHDVKNHIHKNQIKLLKYRYYINFLLDIFEDDLTENLINKCNSHYDNNHIFTCQLDKHATLKKNWI